MFIDALSRQLTYCASRTGAIASSFSHPIQTIQTAMSPRPRLKSFYVVTLRHPDGPKWAEYVKEHIDYLQSKIDAGEIVASGQVVGQPLRAGMYIATVESREAAEKLVADDPFTPAGIVESYDIVEWKPFFGEFADRIEPLPKL